MDIRKLTIGIASFSLIAGAGALAFAKPSQPFGNMPQEDDGNMPEEDGEADDAEQIIALDKAPEAVRNAATKLVGNAKNITQVIQESDDGVTSYEVQYTNGALKSSAVFSTAGELMQLEQAKAEAEIPAEVMAALKKEYPTATFADLFVVTRTTYEVNAIINGELHAVEVDPAGNIDDESEDGDDESEDGQSNPKQ